MAKETRTKLVWEEHTAQNIIPTTLLSKTLKKQKWFTGRIEHFNTLLYIYQNYKSNEMKIVMNWDMRYARFDMYLEYPTTEKYMPGGSYKSPTKIQSVYQEVLLIRIEEAFKCGIIEIEERILEKEEREEKIKIAREFKENLSDELGVPLHMDKYSRHHFTYGKGRAFSLSFEKISIDLTEDEYEITEIEGTFGKKEIKQLIKIIGGNPKAIANRLTSNK